MRGLNMTVEFWNRFCTNVFGIDIFPNTRHYNLRYGAKNLAATKIIFTNGSEDPWKHASVLKTKNKDLIPIEIECDTCAHCVDLHGDYDTDPEILTESRKKIKAIFAKWIKEELKAEQLYPSQAEASLRELLE